MIQNAAELEVWFVTGSQHLYGPETLEQVAEHAAAIARALDASAEIPARVVVRPVRTTPEEIDRLCGEAIDIAGPIGGYNLQAAWSTGFVAGDTAASDCLAADAGREKERGERSVS